jgi:16S rRNA (cytosine967-C5)-methyltransferase
MSNLKKNETDSTISTRWTATKILSQLDKHNSFIDKLLEKEFRSSRLSDLDKRLLNEITNGVLRHRNRIDWVIKQFYNGDILKMNPLLKNSIRVAVYQLLFLDKVPEYAIVNECVNGVKKFISPKLGNLANAVVRNIIRQKDKIIYPDPVKDPVRFLYIYHSHPEWMVRRWFIRFGFEDTAKLLESNNQPKDLTIRINLLKTTREKVEIYLLSNKFKFERSKYIDEFLHIKNVGNIQSLELLEKGEIYVQDDSAGLAVKLLDPQKDERIIDLCAAPGGKLTYTSEKMQNTGEIIAVDVFEMRLKLLQENCDRLGISNVKTMLQDARIINLEPADRILIDAPCSGHGTLSKKPDIKWKHDIDHIYKLNTLQYEILANAANMVKPGGVLVYSTCTIEVEENYSIVEKFLKSHPNFTIENAAQYVPSEVVNENGCVETLPFKHGTDGAFAARLKRIE